MSSLLWQLGKFMSLLMLESKGALDKVTVCHLDKVTVCQVSVTSCTRQAESLAPFLCSPAMVGTGELDPNTPCTSLHTTPILSEVSLQ